MLIRDVAYGMLPKAVRCRKHVEVGEFIRERAGERIDAFVGLVAEHYARAAALGAESGLEPDELAELRTEALELLEAAGDAAAALYSNAEAFERYQSALELTDDIDPAVRAPGSARSRATSRCGWAASTPPSRSGSAASSTTATSEDLARVADLHRKIGAGPVAQGRPRGPRSRTTSAASTC